LTLGGPLPFTRARGYPAGDLKTTLEDFSHFIIAYMNGGLYGGGRILLTTTVEEILRTRNPASGVGLIWYRSVGNWYGHAGGKDGVSAYVKFQPDSKVALMIVTNQNHPSVYPGSRIHALVRRIARGYVGG
jgi:CubicO group peptidase (beta-lactamase class C family)